MDYAETRKEYFQKIMSFFHLDSRQWADLLARREHFQELTSFFHLNSQQWTDLINCKERFIQSKEPPDNLPLVRSEIAHSWIRSHSHGILPEIVLRDKALQPSQFIKVLKDNKLLLKAAAPVLKETLAFLNSSLLCHVALTDRNGILLTSHNPQDEQLKYPGLNLSEEVIGTAAHSLCATHSKPICVIGPEAYNRILQKGNVVISIPIHEANDTVAAVMTIACYRNLKHTKEEKELFTWLIAWQFSTAQKIQEAFTLAKRKFQINIEHNILNSALTMVDDNLIFIDRNGEINHISRGGELLLGVSAAKAKGKHYSDIIGQLPHWSKILQGNLNVPTTFTIISGKSGSIQCSIDIKPLLTDQQDIEGAVIRLNELTVKNISSEKAEGFTAIYSFNDILGESAEITRAKQLAHKMAHTSMSILLTGETGTGKEVFAHSIHNETLPGKPFVAINCASIPKDLIESELFGYEGGSFTGAERKGRIGKIEMANGGTLFLDEIGDMPLALQAVLLRVLEDKRVIRIGGNKYIPVDFRVIAATNKNLYEMALQKTFREDLYFRLATCKITIPSLQQRGNDLISLIKYFIEQQCNQLKLPVYEIDPTALQILIKYNWPGNIRQLKSAMTFAVNMAENGVIKPSDLPEEISGVTYSPTNFKPISELEKQAITDVMKYTDNDLAKSSSILGMSRTTLYRRLKEYNFPV
jgi:transcriptional regulator with PAS, ATPase and Fis domain